MLSQKNIIKMMEKVNKTFVSVTGHSISFIDTEGKSVLPFNMGIFSDFCRYVINSDKGSIKCLECNNVITYGCHNNEKRIFQCYMGLTMMAIPIVIDGKCNYGITCGQMLQEGDQEKFFNQLKYRASETQLDVQKLIEYGKKVKVLDGNEIEARMMFLSMLAEYISITETQLEMSRQYARNLEDKIKMEKNLRKTQFKFLQAQISPHFLFNTLNLLVRVAINESALKTADLIYNLSDLLRRSYKTSESNCTLKEEFYHIKSYLNIHINRYLGLLKTKIYIEEEVETVIIPLFSLQPFVENAVIHGIEPINREGIISISAVKKDNRAIVTITDNGAGIKQENINDILEGQIEPSRVQASGMGIRNVKERLDLFFEDSYTLDIKSISNHGTKVTISIPLILGRGE